MLGIIWEPCSCLAMMVLLSIFIGATSPLRILQLETKLGHISDSHVLLAIHHFNQRIPSLAFISSCTLNISLVQHCEDLTTDRNAAQTLSTFHNTYDGVLIDETSTVKVIAPIAQAFDNALVVSYRPVNEIKPSFASTFVSNAQIFLRLAEFIREINFTRGILLVETVPEFLDASRTFLQALPPEIEFKTFAFSDSDTLELSLKAIAKTYRNLIVLFAHTEHLSNVSRIAASQDLNSFEHVWITINRNEHIDFVNDRELALFLVGSFQITVALNDSALYSEYVQQYRNDLDALPQSACPRFPLDDVALSSLFAYDAVLTLGIAKCLNLQDWDDVVFTGATGPVRFKNNHRDPNTVRFRLENVKHHPNGEIEVIEVGFWEDQVLNTVLPLYFRTGSTLAPKNYRAIVKEEFNLFPYELALASMVLAALTFLLLFSCVTWLYVNRNHSVIRRSQVWFMLVIALGSFLAILSLFSMSIQELLPTAVDVCFAIPCFFFLGFTLVLTACTSKTYRLKAILQRRMIPDSMVFVMYIGFWLGCNALVLIPFIALDPWTFVRTALRVDPLTENVISSQQQCEMQHAGWFLSLLVLFFLIQSLILCKVSEGCKFQEERHLGMALCQTMVYLCLVCISVFDDVIGRFVVIYSGIWFCVLLTLGFTFVPKYVEIKRERLHAEFEEKKKAFLEDHPQIGDCLQGLLLPKVRKKFASFAEQHFVLESYLFIVDVLDFQLAFPTLSESERIARATSILKVYILAESMLQVNVSEELREKTVKMFHECKSQQTCFNSVLSEVAWMMNRSAWLVFIQEGGMYMEESRDSMKKVRKTRFSKLLDSPATVSRTMSKLALS